MTYKPGIDEGKIDCFTLQLSLRAFQSAGTHYARLQFRRVCDIYEQRDVHGRGEVWIGKAFHFPTIFVTSRLQNHRSLRLITRLYATLILLTTHRLSRMRSPSEEHRTQITDSG